MEHDLVFSQAQWDTVLGALVITMFALLAGFLHALTSRSEVSSKYRPTMSASASLQLVAFVSFIGLTLSWIVGFEPTPDDQYLPNSRFEYSNGLRYLDWSISVPMLTVELVAISTLTGARALRTRTILVTSAALMIVTGYLGEQVFGDRGEDDAQLLI